MTFLTQYLAYSTSLPQDAFDYQFFTTRYTSDFYIIKWLNVFFSGQFLGDIKGTLLNIVIYSEKRREQKKPLGAQGALVVYFPE